MKKVDLHFRLRIPQELRERVEAAALVNDRSMTAEINSRLADSFVRDFEENLSLSKDPQLLELMADLDRIKRKIVDLKR